jgi:pimeloyl-ACP methyl ester carboxylesterase
MDARARWYTGRVPPASLHVEESGSGPPVLLLHGAGGSAADWPAEARTVAGRRILAVDLPGHGASPGPPLPSVAALAEAMAGFLEDLGAGPALVAGHSMGGAIALWMALKHPAAVSALALVSTGARLRVAPALLAGLVAPGAFPATVETLVEWELGPGAAPVLRDRQRRALHRAGPTVTHGDFLACDAFDASARLGAVRVPALVLCGSEDRMTPPRLSRSLAEGLPAARLEIVPGAGHMLPLEDPGAVARALASIRA